MEKQKEFVHRDLERVKIGGKYDGENENVDDMLRKKGD